MSSILINSKIYSGHILKEFKETEFKYEPMFFSCDWNYAYENGGEPTKEFLLSLPSSWHNNKTIIDSRVHMLMKGWYPCIPGFHHDDVPRERSDGQPEYFNPSYRSEHAMVLYNGDICPTEFALGVATFDDVPLGEKYYQKWHPQIVNLLNNKVLKSYKAPKNQVIFFDDRTWHQGTQCVKDGWRLFIRASRNTNRPILNEIRKQVQVYMPNPMEGW